MRRSRSRSRLGLAAAIILSVVVALAPLAVGGVHGPVVLVLSSLAILACGLCLTSEWRGGGQVRFSKGAAFPAAFVLLTLVQVIPLPAAIVNHLDPNGAALLLEAGGIDGGWRPLTLDLPATVEVLLRSVIALLIFMLAYHLTAKRVGRSWILRSVASAGVAAVILGLGHRIFAIPRIYGLFENGRMNPLLLGPFINANHTAEFLELATFVSVACARQAITPLSRISWYGGAVVCAAGALATLSRSSVFALGIGLTVVVVARFIEPQPLSPPGQARRTWLALLTIISALVLVAVSIGAGALLDRFRANAIGQDMRLGVWRDSLNVLRAHPFGIGRGAFDTVYPIYRTLDIGRPVRFSFVENEPLQMLIDFGYVGVAVLVAAAVVLLRAFLTRARRDSVQIALLAALVAVAAHSVTDFGLETMGVLLPVMAVLATMLGRSRNSTGESPLVSPAPSLSRTRARVFAVMATILVLGVGSIAWSAQAAGRDYDTELSHTVTRADRRALLQEARRAHPLDYYYPLLQSAVEPLAAPSGPSPRLHTLNLALRLCMNCPEVHVQVARTMWQIGRRSQALSAWATAARTQPALFQRAVEELLGLGAKPMELRRVAGDDPGRLLQLAARLVGAAPVDEIDEVIEAAAQLGAAPMDVALLRARLRLTGSDVSAMEQAVARAKQLAGGDPRVALLEAQLLQHQKGPAGAAEPLALVERALDRSPNDLDLQRKRVELVAVSERWSAAERAISGFKQALQEAGHSTVEANLAAAGIYLKLGRLREAMAEYRIASTAEPSNVTVWRQMASAAEGARYFVVAREAYGELMRLSPDRQTADAMRRIDDAQTAERLGASTPPGSLVPQGR